MKMRFLHLALPAILLLTGARLKEDELKEYKITGYAQGTTYHITYYSTKESIIAAQIDSILGEIDQSMSLYKKGSLINQFNASAQGIKLDAHFKKVILKSLNVYQVSGGYFDITVGPLVEAWGFGAVKAAALPNITEIKRIKKYVGSNLLFLKKDFLYKKDKRVKIDVNGIAQGYSVDVLANFLESRRIYNYMVELGGEIRVKGRKRPTGDKFTIGIESPVSDEEQQTMQKIIAIDAGAITTSGNYRKFYTSGNKKIAHLINPQTGYPLQNEMISATVYANDAITADGYDNVFMGMGVAKSMLFLNRHPNMQAYFIYQKKDGTIADTASTGFYHFIKTTKEN